MKIDLLRLILWAVVSVLVLYLVSFLSLPLYIVLSPVVFIGIVLGLKYFSKEELNDLSSLINLKSKWLSYL